MELVSYLAVFVCFYVCTLICSGQLPRIEIKNGWKFLHCNESGLMCFIREC